MSRSRLLVLAVVALAMAAGTVWFGQHAAADPAPPPSADAGRPNIVMVLVDDLDALTMPYWDALPRTRALIRDRGVEFSDAFAPTPICCPARATVLTGQYGQNTGVLTNSGDQGGWETFVDNGNEDRTVAVALEDAGYRTALVGKYLNGIEDAPTHIPPGWSEWHAGVTNSMYTGYGYTMNDNGTLNSYGSAPEDYFTDVIADRSAEVVRRAAETPEQPLFLYVAPTAPHLPIQPAPRHADHPWVGDPAPRNPNFQEADVSDKPYWLRSTAEDRAAQVDAVNDTDYQDRMGSLLAVDDLVVRIVDELRATGRLENTYLVFGSDNGYNMGAHRLLNKMAPYEESLRVPLVISGPGIEPGRTGAMVLQTDYAPTFRELAGLPPDPDADGVSLAPVLRGDARSVGREDFIARYVTGGAGNDTDLPDGAAAAAGFDIPTWRAVRTRQHLYVEWYEPDRPTEYELYDLHADPWQLTNLVATRAGAVEEAEVVAELAARLDELSTCSGESCRAG